MKKEYIDKMLTWGGKSVVDNIEYDKLIDEDIKGEEEILKRMYLFTDFKVVIIGNDLGNCHDSCRELLRQGYEVDTGWALSSIGDYWFRHSWGIDYKKKIIYETTGRKARLYAGIGEG